MKKLQNGPVLTEQEVIENIIANIGSQRTCNSRYILAIAAFGYTDIAYDLNENMTEANLKGYIEVFTKDEADTLMRQILLDFLEDFQYNKKREDQLIRKHYEDIYADWDREDLLEQVLKFECIGEIREANLKMLEEKNGKN